MNRYAAGRRAEWRARKILETVYGATVIRSAGSKGRIDLVALTKRDVILAQVKRTKSGAWIDSNWRELEALARQNAFPYARVVAIVFTYGKTDPEFFWVGGGK